MRNSSVGSSNRYVAIAAVWVAAAGCRPDPNDFYSRTYPCDSTQSADQCGTGPNGAPLTCFPAKGLGATDFCALTCDPGQPDPSGATLCVGSGTSLKTCHPSHQDPSQECGDQQSCYRTDLIEDEGVCMTGQPCTTDRDCPSADRATCGTSLVKAIYPDGPPLQVDHLNCVKTGCMLNNSSCSPGEYCVPNRVPPQSAPADVCLPLCDANLQCPPNYVCFRAVSGPAAPPVCIPGLLGYKCRTDVDCLIGSCVDTSAGFRVCSVPCQTQADCAPYDGARDAYVCTSPTPGAPLHCITPSSFGGAPCATDADCAIDGTHCTFYSPYGPITPGQGLCLLPCDASGACPARGGIPHACLEASSPPICYAGRLGIDCHSDADCVGELRCLPGPRLQADDQTIEEPYCSVPCMTDADCELDAFGRANVAWCDGGRCNLPRPGDYLCDRDGQCVSQQCVPSTRPAEVGSGVNRCVAAAISLF